MQKRGCIIDDNDQEIDFEIVEGFPDFQIGQGVRFQIKLTTLGLMATNLLFLWFIRLIAFCEVER